MLKSKDLNSFSAFLLVEEAMKRGIKVNKIEIGNKKSQVVLRYNDKVETIIGQRIISVSYNAYYICKKKHLTKKFFENNNISTPPGKFFAEREIDEALNYCDDIGFPLVIKETEGTWGNNVFIGVKNRREARDCIEKITKTENSFLIEKQIEGDEYRILATKEKTLGIIKRIPANVIGDGKSSIKELVDQKNLDPRRGDGHSKSLVKIKIDEEVKNILKEQKITSSDIPMKGDQIFLRKNSNLSTGGDSYDYTDEVHEDVKKLAPQIISAIPGLPYGGIDFMTPDITKSPSEVGYSVIEINDSPMLSMHHFPYEGKERNVAKDIIDLLFK